MNKDFAPQCATVSNLKGGSVDRKTSRLPANLGSTVYHKRPGDRLVAGRLTESPTSDTSPYLLHPIAEIYEDYDLVLLWRLPICEGPKLGSYLDLDFDEADYTHFSLLPDCRLMTATDGAKVGE